MILDAISEAQQSGATLGSCCDVAGVDARTTQRWRLNLEGVDRRKGPLSVPHNKLRTDEIEEVLKVVNSPKHRNLSPKQIVPLLADEGQYLASESTIYRLLKRESLAAHRGDTKPREPRKIVEHCATAPLQVWSWDITYLRSSVTRGVFFYLYLTVDIWSRKIVGAAVHEVECGELAADFFRESIQVEGADPETLAVHQDNGGPMKSATLKATLESLGVLASYSRPRVSDDNPYSESLFRVLKYRPGYPRDGFENIEAARVWVASFVNWYNHEHLHSGIGFVTPVGRHEGRAAATLAARGAVYEAAKTLHPERWGSRRTRNWSAPKRVYLNPSKETLAASAAVKKIEDSIRYAA